MGSPADLRAEREAHPHVPELDGLRGLAILLVLLFHYVALEAPAGRGGWGEGARESLGLAWSGVDLFFVLSGFLIGGLLLEHRASPRYFSTFYIRRACRILPLYVLLLLLVFGWRTLAGAGTVPSVAWLERAPFMPALSYLTFTQNIFMAARNSFGAEWLGVTWSLAVEEQFYLALPLLIWIVPRRRLAPLLVMLVLSAPVVRLVFVQYHPHQGFPGHVLMPGRADALLGGVLAALLLQSAAVRAWLSENLDALRGIGAVLLVGTALLGVRGAGIGSFRMSFLGNTWMAALFVVLVVLALVEARGPVSWVARRTSLGWLGRVSYGVYLFHMPVSGLMHGLLRGSEPSLASGNGATVTVLALATTLLLAEALHRWVEQPFIRWGHSYTFEGPAAVSALPAAATR